MTKFSRRNNFMHPKPDLQPGELPATAERKEIKPRVNERDIPQRKDYVAPVVKPAPAPPVTEVIPRNDYVMDTLLDAHRFIAINAVWPEEKALAEKIRVLISGE